MNNAIAVIIPVYNGERFIKEAMDSIVKQTFQPAEIIIINDGSTDRTSEVLQGLDLTNLKVIDQENAGVSAARNNGVEQCQSDILAFMDVDDLWHPQKLEIQLNELLEHDFKLICTNFVKISEDESNVSEHDLMSQITKDITHPLPLETVLYKPHLTTSSVMVSREVFESVEGFDETFKTAEDQVFYMDVANKFKVGRIDLPLTYKRRVDNSLSFGVESYLDSMKALERFKILNPDMERNIYHVIRKARARIYRELGADYIWEKNTSDALRPLLQSFKEYPTLESVILLIKYIKASIFDKTLRRLKE